MPEENERTIRIPIKPLPEGHKVRTIVISREQGIKALYDVNDKKIVTYLFAKANGWTMSSAQEWVRNHKQVKECKEICVDQEIDFIKLNIEYDDGTTESFEPSYGEHFVVTKEMSILQEAEMNELNKAKADTAQMFCPNCGWNGKADVGDKCPDCGSKVKAKPPKKEQEKEKQRQEHMEEEKARGEGQGVGGQRQGDGGASKCVCPKCGAEVAHVKGKPCSEQECPKCGTKMVGKSKSEKADYGDAMEIIKADKTKQIVYGVFLWPEKADTDGDIISIDDIEKVAHNFLVEYRDIDEMHAKKTTNADIVESFIAWKDNLEYYGKMLSHGAWAGAIHVKDKAVWEKIEKGEYKGFSVRISGRREPVGSIGG